MAEPNKMQGMLAQLRGQLKAGRPKPKPRVTAEPQEEGPQKRGVGPTPGHVKGIDDVDTREGTESEIAALAKQASERTDAQQVPEPEEVPGPLEEDPGLAESLESDDSGLAELSESPAVRALEQAPDDPMEDVTQQSAPESPAEEESGTAVIDAAIEDALAPEEETVSGSEVESLPPSSAPSAEEAPAQEPTASVSAVAAMVMEQMGAMVEEKLAPLRRQLEEIQTNVDETVQEVREKMAELAESSLGMETFEAFFENDFAPVLESVEHVDAMKTQVDRIEDELKGVNKELSGDDGIVDKLSKELDALKTRVENDTVTSEMWNKFLEEEYLPVAELRDELEELALPELAKAWRELSVKWEQLVGPEGERIPGMVHAHREASIVVAVEILRNTDQDNFHRLQDFVEEYGKGWVMDVLSYIAADEALVADKVALAKYNVIYSHMATSAKLQSGKAAVDAEVQKVLTFAKQLTEGDS